MNISDVANKYALTADTLRYYEKIGLIKANRTSSGIRDYSSENLKRVEFVTCMRKAGLSIEFLQKYLSLLEKGDTTLTERQDILKKQKHILTQKMMAMQETMNRLDYKIAYYEKMMAEKTNEMEKK